MARIADLSSEYDDEELLPEDQLDELEFTDEEIEEVLGKSPLDDLGSDEDDEEESERPDDEDDDEAADAPPPANPRTGQPRNADGTFAPKPEGTEAAPAEPSATSAPATSATGATGPTPTEAATAPATAGAREAGTAATETQATATAATAATEPEPLRYRAGGREYTVPGSRVTDEGVFIPREALNDTLRTLSRGVYHDQAFQSWQQERAALGERLQAAEGYRSEAEIRFTTYLREFEKMADAALEGDEQPFLQWFENLTRNLPLLRAQAERAVGQWERERLAAGGTVAAGGPGQLGAAESGAGGNGLGGAAAELGLPPEQIEQGVRAMLPDAIERARELPEFMGLSDDAARATAELIERTELWPSLFYVVTRDDPARGYSRGDVLVDHQRLGKLLAEQERLIREQRTRRADADAVAERNRQRGVVTAPGAAKANGTPAAASTKAAAPAKGHIPPMPATGDREAYEQWSQLPLSLRIASQEQGRRAPRGQWRRDG